MRDHAIKTGTVRIKPAQQYGKGHGPIRLANMLLDRQWTEPLPIFAWAIEHPEGLIVVDTGETSDAMTPGYYPSWHPFYRFGLKVNTTRIDEIDYGLRSVGLSTSDVRWVVMTHLHTDHAGGLGHFPKADIIVSRREWTDATGKFSRLSGYLVDRWPPWLKPRLVDFPPSAKGPYPDAVSLTKAGDVWLAPTPGHTTGHLSVILIDGGWAYFIAGDTSYTEDAMHSLHVSGVSLVEGVERSTLSTIRSFTTKQPTVYLPTHDPGSTARLDEFIGFASPVG